MAIRYVVLSDKISGDSAVLSPATMQELGLDDGAAIAVNSLTSFCSLPAVGNAAVGPNQIKLPRKVCLTMREGERLTVQPKPPEIPLTQLNGGAPSKRPSPAPKERSPAAPSGKPSADAPSSGPAPADAKAPPAAAQQHVDAASLVQWDSTGDTTLDDIAGLAAVKGRVEESLYYLTHPEWFLIHKLLPPRVFLLFGPYGCGKTMLAKAIANALSRPSSGGIALDIRLKNLRPTDVKDPYLSMSARHIQQFLTAAHEECNRGATVLLILDEIDSLVSNRGDDKTHEEYRDVVNSIIQEVQGVQELDTETRIRKLWHDKEVAEVRDRIAEIVRKKGRRDSKGDIMLPETEWTAEIKQQMLGLRRRITEAGGVSTVIIVGTTNDPLRVDEAFVSRAGNNIFFVSRPSAEAIEKMLGQNLDRQFFDLSPEERRTLAKDAFQAGLTGRDIVLSWLQPLQQLAPGSLTIMGFNSVQARQPEPVVGIEWEVDLYKRLKQRGNVALANQVGAYLEELKATLPASEPPAAAAGRPAERGGKDPQKQPALFEI